MEPTQSEVRLATLADVDAVAETVAASFAMDPAWSFMIGAGERAGMEAFARALLIPRVRRGTAWVTDEGTAVAMWDRVALEQPDDPDHGAEWRKFRVEVGEETCVRIDAYESAVRAVAPAAPYWYLGVLATHPDVQGQGLATAVMQPGFAAAEADEWDCWLETSTLENKAFYAGRGFTEPVTIDIPGGPPTWWLRRPKRSR